MNCTAAQKRVRNGSVLDIGNSELNLAERRIGPTRWRPQRLAECNCDTEEYNSSLRWDAIQIHLRNVCKTPRQPIHQLLLLRQQIQQTALWRCVGAGLVCVGDICAGGPLAGQQVADAFEDATGFLTDIHAESFGDADTGLEEDAANGEFLEIALRRTDGSLHSARGSG